MKWVLVIAVLAAVIGYLFYKQPWAPHPASPVPVESHSEASASAPAPAVAALPAPASPVVKHIAPKGVYFLLQAVSITSDAGITTLTAGKKVNFVKAKGKNWVVTDGQSQAEVAPDQLTNDLDVADAAAKHTLEQDAAASASVRSQREAAQQDQAARMAKEQQWEAATRASAAATAAPAPTGTYAPAANNPPRSTGGTPPPFGRPAE